MRIFVRAMLSFLLFVLTAPTANALTVQDGFDPNIGGRVEQIALQPNGKILIGGAFNAVSGYTTHKLASRLNTDGSLDSPFRPFSTSEVSVKAMVLQPDGKIILGGYFTTLSPNGGAAVTRNHIARINSDATLDAAFDPNTDSWVFAIALHADDKILIGGHFTSLSPNGSVAVTRNKIARLNADGTVDTSFDPNVTGTVSAITVQPDSKILIGGAFTSLNPKDTGAVTRNNIARLNADGTLDTSFNPAADNEVRAITVQPDGKILIGGTFTSLNPNGSGAVARLRIARLNADGSVDTSFDPRAESNVYAIAVQSDGKILIGGGFSSLNPNGTGVVTRTGIARLNTDGSVDSSFDPQPDKYPGSASIFAIALQPDGRILIGGEFDSLNPNGSGAVTRNNMARLNADGSLDDVFDPNTSIIETVAVQPDEKILIGGRFTSLNPNGSGAVTRNRVARLTTGGSVDTVFNPNANDLVLALAVQSDGKILLGGTFSTLSPNGSGAVTRNRIARVNSDGSLDSAFNPNVSGPGSSVDAIVIQPDGKILIGGTFTTLAPNGSGAVTRNNIARLNADGSLDSSFNPDAGSAVRTIAVQSDGKILIGGAFTSLNPTGLSAVTRNRIARLNTDGSLDSSFDPNAGGGSVEAILLQADGKLLMAGAFTSVSSVTRNRIARLTSSGSLDASFDPDADGPLYSIALQTDGKILIGGVFSSLNPNGSGIVMRYNMARLNADGSVDMAFDPYVIGQVYGIAVRSDGRVIVVGDIVGLDPNGTGLVTRNSIAMMQDEIALQSLSAAPDGTSVTWLRSGSGPEVQRVTFEISTDGSAWTALGNGSRITGGWQLTGLTIPNNQIRYIRARGYYSTGQGNGSGSIAESLEQVYLGVCATCTLTVNKSHLSVGFGTFSTTPAGNPGITNCDRNCLSTFTPLQHITITATPNTGSYVRAWLGDCTPGVSNTCTLDIYKTSAVFVELGLNAYFTADPLSGAAPLLVRFFNESPITYTSTWTFGDGGTSSVRDPEHRYQAAGTFTANLETKIHGNPVTYTYTRDITVTTCGTPARHGNTTFTTDPSIMTAFSGAAYNDVIEVLALTYTENFTFGGHSNAVTRRGGYDCLYSTNTGAFTTLSTQNGPVIFSAGPVTVENIIVK